VMAARSVSTGRCDMNAETVAAVESASTAGGGRIAGTAVAVESASTAGSIWHAKNATVAAAVVAAVVMRPMQAHPNSRRLHYSALRRVHAAAAHNRP
jgi:hypothetical protein